MSFGCSKRWASAVALAGALLAAPAQADEAGALSAPGESATSLSMPSFVLLIVTAEMAPPPSFEARVLSWFADSSAQLDAERRTELDRGSVLAGPAHAGVQVWLLPRSTDGVRLFFSVQDGKGGGVRYLMTDFALAHGMDELGLEQVAQVIYLSATALWEGRLESSRQEVEQGLSEARPVAPLAAPAAPPPLAPAPAPIPPARSRESSRAKLTVSTGLGYGVRWRGDEGLVHGPSGLFSLTSMVGAYELGGRAQASLLFPSTEVRRGVELELRGYSFTLGPCLARAVSERVSLGAELGVGIDWVRFAASAERDSGWQTGAAEWEARPLLAAGLGATLHWGWLRLGIAGKLAFQLLDTRYEVVEPSGQSLLLAPWPVQPGLALEATW
jgi:hypothetical protein